MLVARMAGSAGGMAIVTRSRDLTTISTQLNPYFANVGIVRTNPNTDRHAIMVTATYESLTNRNDIFNG